MNEREFILRFGADFQTLDQALDALNQKIKTSMNPGALNAFKLGLDNAEKATETMSIKVADLGKKFAGLNETQLLLIRASAQLNPQLQKVISLYDQQAAAIARAKQEAMKLADAERKAAEQAVLRPSGPTSMQLRSGSASILRNQALVAGQGNGVDFKALARDLGVNNQQMLQMAKSVGITNTGLEQMGGFWQKAAGRFAMHLVQWTAWLAIIEGVTGAISNLEKELGKAIKEAGVFEVQGVLFDAGKRTAKDVGRKVDSTSSNDVLKSSIDLAIKYGDNVNDVAQDVTQWYKATGNLNAALFMTNEALKFQTATGTDLQDIYRTLTAVGFQAKGIKMGLGDDTKFNLTKTHELLNDIYAASTLAGAGMKQLASSGREGALGMGNAAGTLMKSLEEDVSVLKSMGLNLQQVIALNQGLVTAMGNTGQQAQNVGNNLSRLVAGIANLSKESKASQLSKDLGLEKFKEFQTAVNTNGKNGEFFDKFAKFYSELDDKGKNILATSIASQRTYELSANVTQVMLTRFKELYKVQQDKTLLDDTESKMMGTYEMELKQVNAQWDAMTIIIGTALLPLIKATLAYIMQMGPSILSIAQTAHNVMANSGQDGVTEALANRYPKLAAPRWSGDALNKARSLDSNLYAGRQLWHVVRAHAAEQGVDVSSIVAGMGLGSARDKTELNNPNAETMLRRLGAAKGTKGFHDLGAQLLGNSLDGFGQGGGYLASGRLETSSKDFGKQAQYQLDKKGQEALLAALKGATETGGPYVADPKAKGAKGAASQASIEADAIANLKQKYTDLIDARKDNLIKIDDEIKLGERGVSRYGANSAYMDQVIIGLKHKRTELKAEEQILIAEVNAFTKELTNALNKQAHTKAGTTARTGADANVRRIRQDLNTGRMDLSRNRGLQADSTDSIDKYMEKIIEDRYTKLGRANDQDLANAIKKYNDADGLGGKRAQLAPLGTAYNDSLSTINQQIYELNQHKKNQGGILTETEESELQTAIAKRTQLLEQQTERTKTLRNETEALNRSLIKAFASSGQGLEDALVGAANFKAPDKAMYDEMFKIQRQIIDQKEQWKLKDLEIGKGTDAQTVAERQLNDAELSRSLLLDGINLKLAEQKRRVDTITSSDLYRATDSALGVATSSLSSGFMSQLSGQNSSNAKVTQLDKETQAIEHQAQVLNDIYSLQKNHTAQEDAMHAIFMRNAAAEAAALKAKATAEKERQANPSLLKKVFDDFSKNMFDGFVTQLKTKLMAGVFNTDPNKELRDSMKLYADVTRKDLVDALGTGPDGFSGSVNHFDAITQMFAGAVANLGQILALPPASGGGPSLGNAPNVNVNQNNLFAPNNSAGTPSPQAIAGLVAGATAAGVQIAFGGGGGMPGVGGMSTSLGGAPTGISSTAAGMAASFLSRPMSNQVALVQYGKGDSLEPGGFSTNGKAGPPGSGGVAGMGSSLQNFLHIPKGQHGIFGGTGSLGKYGQIAGATLGFYDAVTGTNPNGTVGGINHAFQGAVAGAELGSYFGPVGTAVGAGVGFIAGLFGIGQHTAASDMPDKSDTARFTQYVGELQGSAATAYGPAFNAGSDPIIQQLKSPMLDYIQSWVAKNLSSGNPDKKKLAQQLDSLYGHTPGQGLGFGHHLQDEWVKGGSLRGTYVDIYGQASNDIQNILQLDGSTATPQQLVGLNQYGSNSGFFPYSWDTPGYNAPASPPGTGYPVAPPSGVTTGGGSTTGGGGGTGGGGTGGGSRRGAINPSSYAYNVPSVSISAAPIVVNQNISMPVDGRMLARLNQSYTMRATSAGYQRVT